MACLIAGTHDSIFSLCLSFCSSHLITRLWFEPTASAIPFKVRRLLRKGMRLQPRPIPTAVFYNPAGMTQLHGIQHTIGVQFVNVNTQFTSPTGVSTSNEQPLPIGLPPPGQLFITAKLKNLGVHALGDLSVGLGVQNLFGFARSILRIALLQAR